jgi:hypothetical protein
VATPSDLLTAKVIRGQFVKVLGHPVSLADKASIVLSALASASNIQNAKLKQAVIKFVLAKSNSMG